MPDPAIMDEAALVRDLLIYADHADEGERISAAYATGKIEPDAKSVMGDTLRQAAAHITAQSAALAEARTKVEALEKDAAFVAHLDAIIAGLTPQQESEISGFVYEGDRMEIAEQLKAKGLRFSWDRSTPLGGAVHHRMGWLVAQSPARALRP